MRPHMNDYPPPPKDRIIGVKVSVKKLISWLKKVLKRKGKG